jgi:hypothetical protein
MSTLSDAMSDSATMLRRNLRHTLRYPATMITSLGCRSSCCGYSSAFSAAR